MLNVNDLICSMNDFKVSTDTNYDLHLDIVRSSLKGKTVDLLPGVDEIITYKFSVVGCTLIEHVLGNYLLFNKDNDTMLSWLDNEVCIFDSQIRNMICNCINEWVLLNL